MQSAQPLGQFQGCRRRCRLCAWGDAGHGPPTWPVLGASSFGLPGLRFPLPAGALIILPLQDCCAGHMRCWSRGLSAEHKQPLRLFLALPLPRPEIARAPLSGRSPAWPPEQPFPDPLWTSPSPFLLGWQPRGVICGLTVLHLGRWHSAGRLATVRCAGSLGHVCAITGHTRATWEHPAEWRQDEPAWVHRLPGVQRLTFIQVSIPLRMPLCIKESPIESLSFKQS